MVEDDLKRTYERIAGFSWAVIAGLLLCPLTVEVVRMSDPSFSGFSPQTATRVRDFIYGIAVVSPLCIRMLRKAILKHGRPSDFRGVLGKLVMVSVISLLVAGVPAVLGCVLFLLGGFYQEFYIALGYSVLVILAYFPRRSQWEKWFAGGAAG